MQGFRTSSSYRPAFDDIESYAPLQSARADPLDRAFRRGGAGNHSFRANHCHRSGKADIAKPMKGLGAVFLRLPYRGKAFRVVYAVQIGDEIWIIHAFQKESTTGIKTQKQEIDVVKDRMRRLKEMLK
jgi:phage-related protein